MLEVMKDLPPGVVGVEAVGRVTRADYKTVLEPMLDAAKKEGRRLRFLYRFGPRFEAFEAGAAWEDMKVGMHSLRLFEGCAVVADAGWIRGWVSVARFFMPCPVKVFGNAEFAEAAPWLAALPGEDAAAPRLLGDSGVVVVEVKAPLTKGDFKRIADVANPWIEEHGILHGVVIHAREFPGWENLSGLVNHMKFVRDHHRKVRRVALAAGGRLATLAPKFAGHFVKAEIRRFEYDDLEAAVAWSAASPEEAVSASASGAGSGGVSGA
jgi:hypothetical protein